MAALSLGDGDDDHVRQFGAIWTLPTSGKYAITACFRRRLALELFGRARIAAAQKEAIDARERKTISLLFLFVKNLER